MWAKFCSFVLDVRSPYGWQRVVLDYKADRLVVGVVELFWVAVAAGFVHAFMPPLANGKKRKDMYVLLAACAWHYILVFTFVAIRQWKWRAFERKSSYKAARRLLSRMELKVALFCTFEYFLVVIVVLLVFCTSGYPGYHIVSPLKFPSITIGTLIFFFFFVVGSWVWEFHRSHVYLVRSIQKVRIQDTEFGPGLIDITGDIVIHDNGDGSEASVRDSQASIDTSDLPPRRSTSRGRLPRDTRRYQGIVSRDGRVPMRSNSQVE